MFLGTPNLSIIGFPVGKYLSFFGTGVDLFFVISGFCMYLMYISNQNKFSLSVYFNYLKKRFKRIAPAYYAAILFYALYEVDFHLDNLDFRYSFISAIFIRNFFFLKTSFGPHFWSLATEWHFYLLLPIMLLACQRYGFIRMIYLFYFISLLFRFYFWYFSVDEYNIINYSILNRLSEFLAGIVIAKAYKEKSDKWYFNSLSVLVIGILLSFCGRILMSDSLINHNNFLIGYFSRVFNLPILSFGFALVIINTIHVKTFFSRIVNSKVFVFLGKYSYSMYLWHWVIAEYICGYISSHYIAHSSSLLLFSFFVSLILLFPISVFSYYLFESFYFNSSKRIS